LIQAMSTGHPGSMGTVHANGPAEALWRLETLALSGETRPAADAVRRQLEAAIDLVVHLARRGEARLVEVVAEVAGDGLHEVYRC
jgi:pilus assembly protein CpaF